jgi:uncharacterized membrane protein YgdD (TMEM256/DUF423 family)
MSWTLSWFRIGAVLAGLSVAAGAFAAHGLDTRLPDMHRNAPPKTVAGQTFAASWKYLQDFKTAAEYQMYHALALMVVGLAAKRSPSRLLALAGCSFLLGIVLFSGSLYVLALTGQSRWGMVTPFGGLLFLVGWGLLAFAIVEGPLELAPLSRNDD